MRTTLRIDDNVYQAASHLSRTSEKPANLLHALVSDKAHQYFEALPSPAKTPHLDSFNELMEASR